jgi:FkbM family methyltransferase
MQTGEDFTFHLDAPGERSPGDGRELSGWIAALRPITEVRLLGAAETPLPLLPRADVAEAFPGHPHVTGFSGRVNAADYRARALHFSFRVGGEARRAALELPAAPTPPAGWRRLLARAEAAWAGARLRGRPSQATRWSQGLRRVLAEVRAERGDAFDRSTGDLVLEHFARTFPDAQVVQIGANNGVSGDPLERWFKAANWSGLLVEPIPHLADALARHYSGRSGIAIERAAISDHDGEAAIYRVAAETGAPSWYQQLATLDRSVLLKNREAIPNLESLIVSEPVPTLTLKSLLGKHGIGRVDLLVIDTEGYDWQVLRQFDFSRFRPRLVMFEHQHLAAADKAAAHALLRSRGYRVAEMPEGDALAWLAG